MTSLRARAEGESAPLYGTALAGQKTNPRSLLAGRGFRLLRQVLVEPLQRLRHMLLDEGAVVPAPLLDDQFRGDAGLLQLCRHRLGLLERDEGVLVAVDDERRRVVLGDVADRRNLLADFLALLFVGDRLERIGLGVEAVEVEGPLDGDDR